MFVSTYHLNPRGSMSWHGERMDPHHSAPLAFGEGQTRTATAVVPPAVAIDAVAGRLSSHGRTGVIKNIVQYLTADEIKALRLVGDKEMHLADPSLTCHLQLRMDKAPFFTAGGEVSMECTKKWLNNRRLLALNDVNARICSDRVADLMVRGFLDSVSRLIVYDCHVHHRTISLLAQLPNLESLVLADQESDQELALDNLESIVAHVGKMHSLKHLDIEFDTTVHGSRLSFLRDLEDLEHLRLRGFDLSYGGLNYMRDLGSLNFLHLCHGNFYSSPANDVNETDLLSLMNSTDNLRHVHLEGFGCLTKVGLRPFCKTSASVERFILKHCQFLSNECLTSIGQMKCLKSLHIIHSAYDDTITYAEEDLQHLTELSSLQSLSLFYVLGNLSDLNVLQGMKIQTLNIAFEDEIESEDFDYLCNSILSAFTSLRKLRIFSEDGVSRKQYHGNLVVEHAAFQFGDLVYLE